MAVYGLASALVLQRPCDSLQVNAALSQNHVPHGGRKGSLCIAQTKPCILLDSMQAMFFWQPRFLESLTSCGVSISLVTILRVALHIPCARAALRTGRALFQGFPSQVASKIHHKKHMMSELFRLIDCLVM